MVKFSYLLNVYESFTTELSFSLFHITDLEPKVTGPVFKIEDDLRGMTKKQLDEERRIMRERAERIRLRLHQNVSFVLKKEDGMTK